MRLCGAVLCGDALLTEAQVRLDHWRGAARRAQGPPAGDCVRQLRLALADDLDTPRALAAVDRWALDSRHGGGADPAAPQQAAAAVRALLGVAL